MKTSTPSIEPSDEAARPLVARLIDFFRERRFEPGDRMPPERILASRLGVGRNALREALAALIALRVVESRPNSGIYLKNLSEESSFEAIILLAELGEAPTAREVIEVVEIRQILELYAVRLACDRRTEADLHELKRTLDETDAALEEGENIVENDQQFHMVLVGAAHNDVLVRILHSFYRLTIERRRSYFSDPKRGRDSAKAHRKLASAIEDRDVELASKLMTKHLDNAKTYWGEIFGAVNPRSAGTRKTRRPTQRII